MLGDRALLGMSTYCLRESGVGGTGSDLPPAGICAWPSRFCGSCDLQSARVLPSPRSRKQQVGLRMARRFRRCAISADSKSVFAQPFRLRVLLRPGGGRGAEGLTVSRHSRQRPQRGGVGDAALPFAARGAGSGRRAHMHLAFRSNRSRIPGRARAGSGPGCLRKPLRRTGCKKNPACSFSRSRLPIPRGSPGKLGL